MRDIKFRSYTPSGMVEIDKIVFKTGIAYFEDVLGYQGIDIEEFPLMQFTGLWDDAGEKIYENDIVEVQDKDETKTKHKSKVYFYHDGALIYHHPAHRRLGHNGLRLLSHYCNYGDGDEYKMSVCSCKVIGNEFENPELLSEVNHEV